MQRMWRQQKSIASSTKLAIFKALISRHLATNSKAVARCKGQKCKQKGKKCAGVNDTQTAVEGPQMLLRWGIAPVSLIAEDFVNALSALPKEQHQVVACCACYESQVEAFSKRHKIDKSFTNFLDLAHCDDVDVVYISALNPFHLELGRLMLDHGKHVLCERPLGMNEAQAIQLIGHAHSKERLLMESMWSRFTPAYQYLGQLVRSGALGCIYQVNCTFGLPLLDVERVNKPALGGGVTMELGVHAIQLSQWLFRMYPFKVDACGELNASGADIKSNIVINYACGRTTNICLSAVETLENVAYVKCTKGDIAIPEYWCPTQIIESKKQTKTFPLPEAANKAASNFPSRVGLCFQAEELRQCLMRGNNQSELYNHNESLLIARIVDEIRYQLGVVYPVDKSNQCGSKH